MRTLLVFGVKTFKITIPDDARVTFGPWSPPNVKKGEYSGDGESKKGTLRIYKGTEKSGTALACFAYVSGFRDLSLGYAEEIAKEEGATVWKDDERGYVREEKVKREKIWIKPEVPMITGETNGGKKK